MDKDDFYAAQIMENDGWEYLCVGDNGCMLFTKVIGGIVYSIDMRKDA